MKSTLALSVISVLALAQISMGQIPQTMSYQGVLKDTGGNLLDGPNDLAFSLFDVATGGTALWSETYQDQEVANGLFLVTLGSTTPLSLPFDKQYWLEIAVNGSPVSPRTQLTATPYSLRAESATTATAVVGTDNVFPSSGNVGIGVASPSSALDVNGDIHVSGAINLSNVTRYYSIPPTAFVPNTSQSTYQTEFFFIRGRTSGALITVYTHVQLPHGANITGFSAGVDDNDASYDISIDFVYITGNNTTYTTITSLSSSDSPGYRR